MRAHLLWLALLGPATLAACSDDDPADPDPTGDDDDEIHDDDDDDDDVDDRRAVTAFVAVALLAWDAEQSRVRSYFVNGVESPPRLLFHMGDDDWDFDFRDADNSCVLALDLSLSTPGDWAASRGVWAGLDYVPSTMSDDCEDWDWAPLFGLRDPTEALSDAPLQLGLGGPLHDQVAAAFPAEARHLIAGGTFAGMPGIPPTNTSYTVSLAVTPDFEIVDPAQGGVQVAAADMQDAGGGLATAYYVWYSVPMALGGNKAWRPAAPDRPARAGRGLPGSVQQAALPPRQELLPLGLPALEHVPHR